MNEAREIRRMILETAYSAGKGHIGSALSVADLMLWISESIPFQELASRFVLSKGHAALAFYSCLHAAGLISREELMTYCQDGSALGTHPHPSSPYVSFASGSLGHGLGVGAGLSMSRAVRREPGHVFVLMSDAELNEGSIWEAALFSSHHRLNNLVAVVDVNGQQALGMTSSILDTSGVDSAWKAIGWNVLEVNGHSRNALEGLALSAHKPNLVLAKTKSGAGVDFMEGQVDWHYLPMTHAQYSRALEALEKT